MGKWHTIKHTVIYIYAKYISLYEDTVYVVCIGLRGLESKRLYTTVHNQVVQLCRQICIENGEVDAWVIVNE